MTLPEWVDALRRAGGAGAVSLQEELAKGHAVLPPSGAFGACFAREPARYAESLLGFEHEPVPGGAPASVVTALEPTAPAFGAGLRAGARVRSIDHSPHDRERPIRVELEDGGTLEYRGAVAWVAGPSWKRVAGIPDERCLSLRRSARGNQ